MQPYLLDGNKFRLFLKYRTSPTGHLPLRGLRRGCKYPEEATRSAWRAELAAEALFTSRVPPIPIHLPVLNGLSMLILCRVDTWLTKMGKKRFPRWDSFASACCNGLQNPKRRAMPRQRSTIFRNQSSISLAL